MPVIQGVWMTEVYVKPYQALHEAHLLIVMLEL